MTKYLSKLPQHNPKKYRLDYNSALWRAPSQLWIDEHGYVDVEQILQKELATYEKHISNWDNPEWTKQRRIAFPDRYPKANVEYAVFWSKKCEEAKADWEREGKRTTAQYASQSLEDSKAYDVFWNYERWWRHLGDVESAKRLVASKAPLPHALIDEIEERYGVKLIVARACSMYTGESSVVVDNSKLHEQLNDYAAKVMELEAENKRLRDGDSSNGKTAVFDTVNGGSSPSSPTTHNQQIKQKGEKIMLKTIPAHKPEIFNMDQRELFRKYGNTFPLEWFIEPDGTLDPHRAETIRSEQFKKNRAGAIERIRGQEQFLTKLRKTKGPQHIIDRNQKDLEKMKAQLESNDKETATVDKQMEEKAVIRALFVAEKLKDHTAISVLEMEKDKRSATFPSVLVRAVEERYGFKLKHVSGSVYSPSQQVTQPAAIIDKLEARIEKLVAENEKLEKANKHLDMTLVQNIKNQETREKKGWQADEHRADIAAMNEKIEKLVDDIKKLEAENKELRDEVSYQSESANIEKQLRTEGKGLVDAIKGAVEDSKTCEKGATLTATEVREFESDCKLRNPPTHRFTYKYSYISGQHGKDFLHVYIGINSLKTNQSDLKKFSEDSMRIPREVGTFFELEGSRTWADSATKQPVAFRRAHQFDNRDNTARIVFELPHSERYMGRLWLNIQLQEMQLDYNPRAVQPMSVAKWCPILRVPLFMSQIGTDWLVHEDQDMFERLGGFVPPEETEETDDPLKPLLDEVWSKARLMEAKNAIVWKKWQAIWDLMTGNPSEINLAEIKKWHDEAKLKGWKPALETLPKVIALLEKKS